MEIWFLQSSKTLFDENPKCPNLVFCQGFFVWGYFWNVKMKIFDKRYIFRHGEIIWAKMTIFDQFWWPETNALEHFWAPRYRLKLRFWKTKIHLITSRIWRLKVAVLRQISSKIICYIFRYREISLRRFWSEIWAKMTIFEQFWWPETNALEQFWAPTYRLKLGFWSTKIHLITNRIWRLKVDFGRAELPHYRKRRGSIFLIKTGILEHHNPPNHE